MNANEFFQNHGRWTALRSVGNSPTIKLTVLIPLVGYLILFNENVLHYIQLSRELIEITPSNVPSAEISRRLLSVYFGLCLIAVGSIIYSWFCPQEIKSFESTTDYIGGVADSISIIEIDRIERRLETGDPIAQSLLQKLREIRIHRPDPETLEEFRGNRTEFEAALLDSYFRFLDRKFAVARLISIISYVCGFVALLIPSMEVFVRVSMLLFRSRF